VLEVMACGVGDVTRGPLPGELFPAPGYGTDS
jgi:hypothetical protein